MAAITVTHNNSVNSPGLDISLTGLDSTGSWTHFRVVRRDLSGALPDQVVRGLDYQAQSSATAAGSDYEAPFSYYPLQYRLEMYTNLTLSSTFTYDLAAPGYFFPASTAMTTAGLQNMATAYLKSVNTPALNLGLVVESFPGYKRSGRILSKSQVLGRANPVIISDVMSGREGSFSFLVGNIYGADQLGSQDDFEQLLADGDVLLFQSVFSKASGVQDLYFEVDSVNVERVTPVTPNVRGNLATNTSYLTDEEYLYPVLRYTVDFTEVDRPATTDVGVTDTTWQDVLDYYATWNDVLTGNSTWLQVLQGTNYPH